MSGVDVHLASFDELEPRTAYQLWQLRESVFVVEQRCPYPELDGRDLERGTRHVWAELAATPIGYLRILDETEHMRVGRVLVAGEHRGRGVAAVLMRHGLDHVGSRACTLDAQSHLAGWYTRFGFETTGPLFLEDGIPHVPMRRDVGAPPA